MSKGKQQSPKRPVAQKRAKGGSQFNEDGEVEIRGEDIYLHGRLAEEMASLSRTFGVSVQELFKRCLRLGLPKFLAEFRASPKSMTIQGNLWQTISWNTLW